MPIYPDQRSGGGGSAATFGYADYSNSNPSANPLNLLPDIAQPIPNDAAGSLTNEDQLPPGVGSLWNPLTSQFNFSTLKIGSTVDIRMDATINTTALNQAWKVELALAVGTPSEYTIEFSSGIRLFTGASQITRFNGIYIGNSETRDNPAELRIVSNNNATVQVSGWYVRVIIP